MKLLPYLLISFGLLLVLVSSCDVETEFLTGETVELRFSTDTLTFDTVFTAVGSATRQFKVYNDGEQPVQIDRVRVAGMTGVDFTFNADGLAGPEAEGLVIFGGDSVFVFVEVTVDPTAPEETSPFITEDRIIFETGSREQDVTLIAYGQNANYINNFNRGDFGGISCQGGTFTLPVELPTVIYGSLVVDDCTLQALAGTRIYVHGGVQQNPDFPPPGFFNDGIIFTTETGNISFEGTLDNPILVATDRLEERFLDDPAKYRGIILGRNSRGNVIEHTQILNAIAGITLDSAAQVTINNSVIAFSGGPAVASFNSEVDITNSVFHSNFGDAVQVQYGGDISLDHVTIANYGADASALVLTNFFEDSEGNFFAAPLRARVRNSIVAGSRSGVIQLADIYGGMVEDGFDVRLFNSVVRTDNNLLEFQDGLFANFYDDICTGCVNITFDDPLFQSVQGDDYQLDSLSVARGIGGPIGIDLDILGVERDGAMPDAGAYERVDQ